MLSESEVVAAVQAVYGEPTHGDQLRAAREGERLWLVALVGGDGLPQPGGAWIVGPDGKVFSISSNPGIHDTRLARRLLDEMYAAGIAHAVEPSAFEDRLRAVTEKREALIKQVLDDARAGALRTTARHLP